MIKPRESLKYGDRYLYLATESGKPVVGLQWVGDYYYFGDVYVHYLYTTEIIIAGRVSWTSPKV